MRLAPEAGGALAGRAGDDDRRRLGVDPGEATDRIEQRVGGCAPLEERLGRLVGGSDSDDAASESAGVSPATTMIARGQVPTPHQSSRRRVWAHHPTTGPVCRTGSRRRRADPVPAPSEVCSRSGPDVAGSRWSTSRSAVRPSSMPATATAVARRRSARSGATAAARDRTRPRMRTRRTTDDAVSREHSLRTPITG